MDKVTLDQLTEAYIHYNQIKVDPEFYRRRGVKPSTIGQTLRFKLFNLLFKWRLI